MWLEDSWTAWSQRGIPPLFNPKGLHYNLTLYPYSWSNMQRITKQWPCQWKTQATKGLHCTQMFICCWSACGMLCTCLIIMNNVNECSCRVSVLYMMCLLGTCLLQTYKNILLVRQNMCQGVAVLFIVHVVQLLPNLHAIYRWVHATSEQKKWKEASFWSLFEK